MRSSARPVGLLLGGLGLLSVAGSAAVALAPPAGAATGGAVTVKVALTQADYFWREQQSDTAGQGVAPPASISDPSVPSGDVAVAGPEGPDGTQSAPSQSTATQTGPDKETYLAFDVSRIPVGATITSFRVTLPVDPAGQNVNVAGQQMVACAPQGDWSADPGPDSFASKPADSCAAKPPALTTHDGGASFTVDIATIAQQWVEAGNLNFGVAITDNPSNTSSVYQVVFGPSSKLTGLTATVSYLPPVALAGVSSSLPGLPGPAGAAATGAAPAPAPASGGTSQSVSAPPVPAPPVAAASAPSRPAGTEPVVATRAAAEVPATSHFPGAPFVLAGVGLLALLVAAMFVLNDENLPHAPRGRHGLDRALRSGVVAFAPSGATSA
jgi:hypothetical protein